MATVTLSADLRSKARHVGLPEGAETLRFFPDFLLVGPQRTATTWIYENLRFHPDIFWPREKDLYFFNLLESPSHPLFRSNELEWYARQFRDSWTWWLFHSGEVALRARARYAPRVRGEATATYAAMAPELVDDVATLNPDVRAVMLIRNPVDRAWSHAKLDLVKLSGRKMQDVSDDEFRRHFTDTYQLRCADYVENCNQWHTRLKPGAFLGDCTDPRYFTRDVAKPVNVTKEARVPERHREFLEQTLRPYTEAIANQFGLVWN